MSARTRATQYIHGSMTNVAEDFTDDSDRTIKFVFHEERV